MYAGCGAVRLAHLVWDQGVAGSNPAIPTIYYSKVTYSCNNGQLSTP